MGASDQQAPRKYLRIWRVGPVVNLSNLEIVRQEGTRSVTRNVEHYKPAADGGIPTEEAARLIHAMKTKHYATWADEPMPALGGKTAREAVRTKAGREQVDLLLKDCENHEAREPIERRFDFSGLRTELGFGV